jgi:ankyrin repeat protein
MKFIHDQARRSSQDSNVVLDFFFNARGVSLEKSTLGMYRSILLQLLTTLPHLQNHLDSVPLPRDGQWSILVLVDLFEQIVQHLEHSSVTVYIDALDECDQDEIRDMIYDFDRVGQLAISSGSTLKICYASRHYPHITLREGLGLEVFLESEKDHTADITAYINSKLTIGQSKLASEILKAKASGVFMWVVLVVQILNKERDRGNMHSLRQKLREIPGDLHKLFQEILAQEQDKEELLLCIQWVLFAETPFKPRELYSAILYTENISTNDVLEEDVHIFITNYSKGLVEITRSRHPTVQFIHESVRDFLLRNDGVRIIWPSLSTGFIADSHMRLAHCCLEYCKIIDTDNVPIPTIQYDYTRGMIPWRDKSSFDDSRKWMEAAFPFLYRAVRSSLFHADEACTHGTLSSDFIHSFQLMLNRWVHLYNLTAISPDQEYLPSTPLLYILASEDRPYLIKATSRALELVDVNDEDDFGCPLLAAIYWENSKAIEAFRECLVSHNQIHGREAKEFRNHEERCSIEFGQKFRSSKRSVLSFLAEHGDTHLLESLILSEKLNINIQMEQDGTEPVVVAAHRGNRAMVKFLIGTGLFDLNSKDQYGRTPLTVASTQGHEAIVRVLLASKLVDPNVMDGQGISSFSRAIRNDHDAVAQILLETGQVNVDETDSNGRTHLSRTAQRGYDPMMECLLGIGQANPDLADLSGRTPLSWAAQCARIPVITRLLNTGRVNPDSRDNNGRTPLSWAAQNSYLAVVRCLLETGRVDPNSCDINGETPASWARRSGRTIIADYILAAVRV